MEERRAVSILVADDDPCIRSLLGRALSKAGYAVTLCANGAEAKGALDDGTYDLVLTDLDMPVSDGYSLMARVREARPSLPVIVMSTDPRADVVQRVCALGARGFLVKPFHSLARVLEDVANVIAEQRLSVGE